MNEENETLLFMRLNEMDSKLDKLLLRKETQHTIAPFPTQAPVAAKPKAQEYEIKCSMCGCVAYVPFEPNPGANNLKCKACYAKSKESERNGR